VSDGNIRAGLDTNDGLNQVEPTDEIISRGLAIPVNIQKRIMISEKENRSPI
jgi:hypothetical protein